MNSDFSRRRFLKSAAFAAVSAPLILRSSVWGAETKPNDQLTFGFIGLGRQGRGLLGNLMRQNGTRVVAVCDVDATRRAAAKAVVEKQYAQETESGTYKGCTAYNDYRDLLGRKDIDGVVIATPDHWHAFIAVAAAKAGKDIYCEKPMSHTVEEGRAMVKAVRANHRVFQVGSMQRSMREFRAACELIRNGAIGTVTRADVAVGGPATPCNLPEEAAEPGLDWNFWLGPAPKRPYNSVLSPRGECDHFPNWRGYREYGGGGVTDWGAHHFDIVQWAFGFDETGPVEILPASEPNAVSGVRVRYANGLEVTHQKGNGVTFYGDKGKIYVNRGKFQLWSGNEQKAEDVGDCQQMLQDLLPSNAVRLYNSANQIADWISSMGSRKPPICDVETGHRSATVCNLVALAYYHGQRLRWDPKAERLVEGTGSSKWLRGDYRGSWKLA